MDAEEKELVGRMQASMDHHLELIKLARTAINLQQGIIEKLITRVTKLEAKLVELEQRVRVGF